jgi:hypothetical protein
MRLREVIEKLRAVEAQHGDVPVVVETHHGDSWAVDAYAYTDSVVGITAVITGVG